MSYIRNIGRALIGRPQLASKASAVGGIIARVMLGQPVWPKRDFERLGREGYQQNAVVARSVQLIADSVAAIAVELHQGRGRRAKILDDHPLLTLLARPNPEQDYQALAAAFVSHLVISGNGYMERTGNGRLDRTELYALRPDRMRLVPGDDGFPAAYEYHVNGVVRRWDMDVDRNKRPILHMKRFHPTEDWYGMSGLDPAAWAIDLHNSASAWNKALLENSGAPSGAFVFSGNDKTGQTLSDEQYDRLKAQIEEQVQGAKNAGRNLILEGGLDYKAMGLDPERMDYIEGKNQAAREIAFALGVPPMLLGIPGDNTYSNYAEANRAFHRQTVIPLAQWLARTLTHWFAADLGDDMRLVVDLDSIEALQVERQALWDKLDRTAFLTINEKREALGYQPVAGGDQVYIGAGLLPIGEDATIAGGPEPDVADDDQQDDTGDQKRARGRLN